MEQMVRRFSSQMYQRPFVGPLRTARGEWSVREGFIVRVEDDTGVGYGEVAPIPEFGSESVEAAGAFLRRLAAAPELAEDRLALASLPCCAFGVSSALASLGPRRRASLPDYKVAALLPAGRGALAAAIGKVAAGYETFKWKIGVEAPAREQAIFRELDGLLPAGTQLRLDANGGLSLAELEAWLDFLQVYRGRVEYMEQPLAIGREAEMARYGAGSGIALALDESLHGAGGERWLAAGAWPGPLVVKPALAGDCGELIERLRPVAARVVFSSVFETHIGLENALAVADALPEPGGAFGFDTSDTFEDSLAGLPSSALIRATDRAAFTPTSIWKRLPHLI